MKLHDYLTEASLTVAQFAVQIDVDGSTVRRYRAGARIPDRDVMARIVKATGGRVTPNDFYGVAA